MHLAQYFTQNLEFQTFQKRLQALPFFAGTNCSLKFFLKNIWKWITIYKTQVRRSKTLNAQKYLKTLFYKKKLVI